MVKLSLFLVFAFLMFISEHVEVIQSGCVVEKVKGFVNKVGTYLKGSKDGNVTSTSESSESNGLLPDGSGGKLKLVDKECCLKTKFENRRK